MNLFVTIGICLLVSYVGSTMAQSEYTYTLNATFIVDAFIPYYPSLDRALTALENDDIVVGNASFITFNLTNGILSSNNGGVNYYLKNQTGHGYPPYVLKRGNAKSTDDVSVFRASRDAAWFGRSLAPNITMTEEPGADNLWVACKNAAGIYAIGWDADSKTQPPEGCVDYAKYDPGVLLHVHFT